MAHHPDPPTLAFLKKKGNPGKKQGFSLRGTPKILGKERKNAQEKQGKSENKKARKSKKQGLEGQGQPKKVRFANFQAKSPELVLQPSL